MMDNEKRNDCAGYLDLVNRNLDKHSVPLLIPRRLADWGTDYGRQLFDYKREKRTRATPHRITRFQLLASRVSDVRNVRLMILQTIPSILRYRNNREWGRCREMGGRMTIKIPKKVQDRLVAGLRRYQPIVRKLAERDISEADTVTVIKDMLTDIFGFDKYVELTSEQQIRGTFCDLAIKVDGKVHYLAEVKSAGTSLNDNHLRQAVNYGAHQGIEWIILTNAIIWKIYRIKFGQPIDWEEVYCFDMGEISSRSADDLGKLYMLCRESVSTDALQEYHRQAQILNRYVAAELLLSEPVIGLLRREFRRLFNGLKTTDEELRILLSNEVIKRDTLDGDSPQAARKLVKKANGPVQRKAKAALSVTN